MKRSYYVYGESRTGYFIVTAKFDRLWKASKVAKYMQEYWGPVFVIDASALPEVDEVGVYHVHA